MTIVAVLTSLILSQGAKRFKDNLMPVKSGSFYPFIGHLPLFLTMRNDLHKSMLTASKENNFKSFFVSMPQNIIFVPHDERDRKYILKDNWLNYQKNYDHMKGFNHAFTEILGQGIFNVDGIEWSTHRKIASNMFTGNNMSKIMSTVFLRHADELKEAFTEFAERKESFDVQIMFQAIIFDAFCEIALGVSPHSFQKSLAGEKDAFLVAFDNCQIAASVRMTDPPFLREIRKFFKLGVEADYQDNLDIVNSYAVEIIQDRLNKFEQEGNLEDSDDFTDMLGLYISHAKSKGLETKMLNTVYLRDMVVNIMIAGRDTTSYVLTNMISLLAENSLAEVEFVKQATKKLESGSQHFAKEGVKDFPFGDAVFYEALRMYPSVGNDPRFCQQEDTLPSGVVVPAGTMVIIANQSYGRNPAYSKDPDSFIPSRWLHNGVCEKPDEYRFPFFWAGNRICLGKDMARFESKLMASILLKDLKFTMVNPRKEEYVVGPVMFYKDGIHLFAEQRHLQNV